MRRTLTPANSPVSSPSKHGDRFIPSRAGANWSVNFHRINVRVHGEAGAGGTAGGQGVTGEAEMPVAGSPGLTLTFSSPRRTRNHPVRTGRPRTPHQTMAKVRSTVLGILPCSSVCHPPTHLYPFRACSRPGPPTSLPLPTDGLAYSALLKNELLGAGIEKVQDPQTEDRRLQPSTPEKKGLFTVSFRAAGVGVEVGVLGVKLQQRLSNAPCSPPLPPQYSLSAKRSSPDDGNDVSPYSLSPVSNKR